MSKPKNNNGQSHGMSFCGLLTIAFITLKLCNVIAWSWWWVLAPLWIGFAIIAVILIVFFAVAAFVK